MRYPTMSEIPTTRDMVDAFGGYNHNLRIGDGEFYDMENMTADHYPILSPRRARGVYATPRDTATGMIGKDALCYIDGSDFIMNGRPYDMKLNGLPKRLVSMGAYVVVTDAVEEIGTVPDKKWFNTQTFTWGSIEAESSNYDGTTKVSDVTFELCKINGDSFGCAEPSDTAPETLDEEGNKIPPADKTLWLDTSGDSVVLKQYSAASETWVQIVTTYIKISYPGIGANFNKYDGVTISVTKNADGSLTAPPDASDSEGATFIDTDMDAIAGSFVIWEKGADDSYIVILGMLRKSRIIQNKVTIKRSMPSMDYVIESGNRLWGCRYGIQNGKIVNEIYASKLGDFKNWNCFMGISTDSYAASVGTDGVFTGAITHMGYPLFFKEGFLHKVYGNYPANYQIQTTACRGVQKDCSQSLAIVNEVLYYKSRLGVCAYDGSLPTEISAALGDIAYFNAAAGSHGNKYYISMADSAGDYHLFVYDTVKGMWHREDSTQVDCFCSCRNEMYYIDHEDGLIKTVFGSGTPDTEPVKWMVESGIIGVDSPDKKYISRLNVRMAMGAGSRAVFYIQYDSIGDFEPVCALSSATLRSFTVPIRPKRCDHMRLRIAGEGDVKIFSVCKTIEQGSDM